MRSPVLSEENDYSAWDSPGLDDDVLPVGDPLPLEMTVEKAGSGERLDKWIAAALAQFSRTRLQAWIAGGHVQVNGLPAQVRQAVWEGDRVSVIPQRLPEESAFLPEAMDLAVVFEDDALIVIDKPAGLVVHPAAGNWQGTLLNGLLEYAPELAALPRAGIVHRLDKDTSGLMVVARSLEAQTDLVRQLQAHTVRRQYLALVHGMPPLEGTIDLPMGRSPRDRKRMAGFRDGGPATKPAITHFRTLGQGTLGSIALALVSCRLETGRTHQIRVHMQSIGHPLFGDPLYGRARQADPFPRQALHAWRLGLVHPATRQEMLFRSEPPADLATLFEEIGLALADIEESTRDA